MLKFARDRRAWIRWVFGAKKKKRCGLCALKYMVAPNHVHLLIEAVGDKLGVRASGRTVRQTEARP